MDISAHPLLDRNNSLDHILDESPKADAVMFSGSVLVAEDVESIQRLMKSVLTQMGLEVSIAKGGLCTESPFGTVLAASV